MQRLLFRSESSGKVGGEGGVGAKWVRGGEGLGSNPEVIGLVFSSSRTM